MIIKYVDCLTLVIDFPKVKTIHRAITILITSK